jgi:hypothetical protein
MKERVVAVVKYPVQTEVVRRLSRVGAVVVWCVANLLAYTQIAQYQAMHPALGKYTSLVVFEIYYHFWYVASYRLDWHPWHLFAPNSSILDMSILAADLALGLPPAISPHFGAPEPLLHRHLEQLAERWHPDQHATHPNFSHDESIRIWDFYEQTFKRYPRHATVERTALLTPEDLAGSRAKSIYKSKKDFNITYHEPYQKDDIPYCACAMGLSALLLQPHALLRPSTRSQTCPPWPSLILRSAFFHTQFPYTARLPPIWYPLWSAPSLHYPNPLDRVLRFAHSAACRNMSCANGLSAVGRSWKIQRCVGKCRSSGITSCADI